MRLTSVLRLAGVVLAAAILVAILDYYQGDILAWLDARKPPVQTAPLPLGDAIAQERDARLIAKVTRAYGRVKAQVDAARAKRLDVSRLDALLLESLSLARQKRFDRALTLINRIDMSVPRPAEKVRPAHESDPLPEDPPLPASGVRKAKKSRKR